MILETIVAVTVALTGTSCAAIDNATNKAVWDSPTTPLVSTTYRDDGVLMYDAPYPTDVPTALAIVHAEDSLQEGAPGRKIPIRCVGADVPYRVYGGTGDHAHN